MTRTSSPGLICLATVLALSPAYAAGVRDFTRTPRGTAVSPVQASELTLTLTEAALRPIQTWVRTAGTLDATGTIVTASVHGPDAGLVQVGQRVRAFSVNSRARMTLARVTKITPQAGGALVEATLPVKSSDDARYLLEIVAEKGPLLSIPNVSIIEEGDDHVAYVQKAPGQYVPQVIQIGTQGELYTEVTAGLARGDQVVSVGSFFVDAENKLKSAGMAAMPGMDHATMAAAMPGMDHGAMPGMTHPAATPAAATGPEIVTDPASGATVKAPLMMIHVMLPQAVDPKTSVFEVTRDGKPVDVGAAMAMGDDGKMLMAMPKTPLPAGRYHVKWRAVGTDKMNLNGEFAFTVQ